MKRRVILTVLLLAVWLFVATLLYKTVVLMLVLLVWRRQVRERLPLRAKGWGMGAIWAVMVIALWVAMPRYRTDCADRVRLLYLDREGGVRHAPLTHYLANVLLPEEEVINLGIHNLTLARPFLRKAGLGNTLIEQAKEDTDRRKIGNFYKPYHNLGLENPMSGVYPQLFNQTFGTNDRVAYVCEPRGDDHVAWSKDNGYKYPLVVFCHGCLGNWQLYQGIWKDLDNCIVLSIGTRGLDGIFTSGDIRDIFDYYLPALQRMDYSIDYDQIHLMGLSNGGSAINAAMHSAWAGMFRSITILSCNLSGLRRVPCQVNLVGGGKDGGSRLLPSQCRRLRTMGVDADIYFDQDENHYIMVNKREEIIQFLKKRMNLRCVATKCEAI